MRRILVVLVTLTAGCQTKGCNVDLSQQVKPCDEQIATDVAGALGDLTNELSNVDSAAAAFRQVLVLGSLGGVSDLVGSRDAGANWTSLATFGVSTNAIYAAQPDGTFRYGGSDDSLIVRVFDPSDAAQVREKLLSLDTYFSGVSLVVDVPVADLVKSPSQVAHFTLAWQAPGPRASVIDPDHRLASPISFDTSLSALGAPGPIAGLEFLDALLDYETEWSVSFSREVGKRGFSFSAQLPLTQLTYEVTGERLSLRQRGQGEPEKLSFSVLDASNNAQTLHATADLRYVYSDGLLGTVTYDITAQTAHRHTIDTYGTPTDADGGTAAASDTVTSTVTVCQ